MKDGSEPGAGAPAGVPPQPPLAASPARVYPSSFILHPYLPVLAHNLALDEALLICAEEGGPAAVRVWEAPELAVVLGASCRIGEDVNRSACQADGVPIARRSSGGGTVVIGPGALNLAVVLPISAAPDLASVTGAQQFVLERLAAALRAFEPNVELKGSGDLTLAGRKFAGSAQRRLRTHVMVHSSILYAFPLPCVSRYTNLPRKQPAYRQGRSHEEFLTNLPLTRSQIIEAIQAAWLAPGAEPAEAEWPQALVDRLIREKFGDPAWVERF